MAEMVHIRTKNAGLF